VVLGQGELPQKQEELQLHEVELHEEHRLQLHEVELHEEHRLQLHEVGLLQEVAPEDEVCQHRSWST